MTTNHTIALSELADINPHIHLRALDGRMPVSFIPMSDVSESGKWCVRQVRQLDQVRTGYTPFAEGDLLFAKITPCMENGKGAHAVGLTNGIGFGSTEFHVLRTRDGNDSRFLYHWLQYGETRRKAIAYMGGSAGQQRVHASFFLHFRVPRIDPDMQSCIAAILDTVDETIGATEAVIAKLKQVRAGLLHDLLTRGLDEHGQLRDFQAHPEQFQDSPLGRIPQDWDVRSLRECLVDSPQNGIYKPARQIGYGTLLIGQTSISDDRLVDSTLARRAEVTEVEIDRYGLNADDILISRVFATLTGVGLPALVTDLPEPAVYESNMMRLHVDPAVILPRLLFEAMRGARFRARVKAAAHLSNQASINQAGLNPIPVGIPRSDEQQEIVRCLCAHEQSVVATENELTKLQDIKSGLMSDLLTGRVRVPEDLVEGTS